MLDTVTYAPITRQDVKAPHGNTRTGLPFVNCEVGDSFTVKPEEYTRANSARAHYQKKMWRLYRRDVKFTSSQVKGPDGRVIAHTFRRER